MNAGKHLLHHKHKKTKDENYTFFNQAYKNGE
jgi:hypothetical protein